MNMIKWICVKFIFEVTEILNEEYLTIDILTG